VIIDTETHVIYRVFPRESNPGQPMTFRPSWHEHSGDLLAAEMDRAGVDKTFMISYDADDIAWFFKFTGIDGDLSDQFGGRNYTLESAVKKHPGRFLWFATLKHVERPDTFARMQKDIADGAVGMKIFPPYMNLPVDDPRLMDVYRWLAENDRRVILSFEDTLPPETPSVTECFEQLDRVLTEFPDLKIQINHAGAGNQNDPASDPLNPEAKIIFDVVNRHDNVWLSTAWLSKKWDDLHEYPFPRYLARLEALRNGVGAERLFWATDWPWLEEHQTYPQAVDSIRKHANFFTEAEKAMFLGQNAEAWIADLVPGFEDARIFTGAAVTT
jgi:predicted TIM-barrel fold metal-dependent hydrolase